MLPLMHVCVLTDVDIPLLISCSVSMHKSDIASMWQWELRRRRKPSHQFVLKLSCHTRKHIAVLEGFYLPCFSPMYPPHTHSHTYTHRGAYLGCSLTVYVFV